MNKTTKDKSNEVRDEADELKAQEQAAQIGERGCCPQCGSHDLAGVGQGGREPIECRDCGNEFNEEDWDDEDLMDAARDDWGVR